MSSSVSTVIVTVTGSFQPIGSASSRSIQTPCLHFPPPGAEEQPDSARPATNNRTVTHLNTRLTSHLLRFCSDVQLPQAVRASTTIATLIDLVHHSFLLLLHHSPCRLLARTGNPSRPLASPVPLRALIIWQRQHLVKPPVHCSIVHSSLPNSHSISANVCDTASIAARCLRYRSDSLIASRRAISRTLRPWRNFSSRMLYKIHSGVVI